MYSIYVRRFASISASNIYAYALLVFGFSRHGLGLDSSLISREHNDFHCKWECLACIKVIQSFQASTCHWVSEMYALWLRLVERLPHHASMIPITVENASWMFFTESKGCFHNALLDALTSLLTLQPFLFSTHSFYAAGGQRCLEAEQINAGFLKMQHHFLHRQEALSQLEPCGCVQRSGARWTYWILLDHIGSYFSQASQCRSMKGGPLPRGGRFLRRPGWRRQRLQRHKTFPWCDFKIFQVQRDTIITPSSCKSDLKLQMRYQMLINNN